MLAVSYAIVLTKPFLQSVARLALLVQETIFDDLDTLIDRADEADSFKSITTHAHIEWHQHRGEIEGVRFDVVIWIAVDPAAQTLKMLDLWDGLADSQ